MGRTACAHSLVPVRRLQRLSLPGKCCRNKDPDKPKELVLLKIFWEKREQAERNIMTRRGIHLRLCRSIRVEGAFRLLKNDFGFRRFLTRGKANIRTELFLLVLAFDLKKL